MNIKHKNRTEIDNSICLYDSRLVQISQKLNEEVTEYPPPPWKGQFCDDREQASQLGTWPESKMVHIPYITLQRNAYQEDRVPLGLSQLGYEAFATFVMSLLGESL